MQTNENGNPIDKMNGMNSAVSKGNVVEKHEPAKRNSFQFEWSVKFHKLRIFFNKNSQWPSLLINESTDYQ